MKITLFARLLPGIFASMILAGCVEEPSASDPKQSTSTPASAPTANKTTSVDMTLPLPRGLKGNPDKAAVFFLQNCATCHGTSGDGEGPRAYFINPPPRNFLLESSRQKLNLPTLFEAISNGRLGTEMPAWSKVLNEQEIADLAEFVFQTFISAPKVDLERETSSK